MLPERQTRSRIRAFRTQEPAALIAARSDALRPFIGMTPQERTKRLRAMLRAERRAAGRGLFYDPLRHAALRRLMDEN